MGVTRARAARIKMPAATPRDDLFRRDSILATPFSSDPVEHAIVLGFVVSLGLWVHVVQGICLSADPRWTLGVGVVANFSAGVVALWLLTDPSGVW